MAWLPHLASADPLEHVLDSSLGPLTETLGITKHVLMMLISAALCIAIFPMIVRRMEIRGSTGRIGNFFEVILLYIRDEVVRPFLGHEGDKYLPIVWTFFFYILFCNLLGLIPGAASATGNINVTVGLALCSALIYHGIGIWHHGPLRYLKNNLLVGPPLLWWMMIPIEIMGHIVRPTALAIRLFANMVAGHLMLAVVVGFTLFFTKSSILLGGGVAVVSAAGAVCLNFLELLVALIQALVFSFLTTVFLSMAVHAEH